ncbi:hypothetical protein D3C77_387170 [compost metagenome]
MADISAPDHPLPETANHFLTVNVAPALINVSFIGAFIDDDRLVPLLTPFQRRFGGFIYIDSLNAGVGQPRLAMIIERQPIVI